MSGRAAPFHCPYCGEEDLRPSEEGGHGAWDCRACNRAFRLHFLGLLSRAGSTGTPGPGAQEPAAQGPATGGSTR